jgi:hypothetical protein
MSNSDVVRSFSDIERVIQAGLRSESATSERRASHSSSSMTAVPDVAMLDFVEHREGVPEIGKLSAEAVVGEYEATAKEIESMGADLIECVKKYEAMASDALAVTEKLGEVAAGYRAEAKRVFEHIENCSLLVAQAHQVCVEMKDKIARPIGIKTETRGKSPKRGPHNGAS